MRTSGESVGRTTVRAGDVGRLAVLAMVAWAGACGDGAGPAGAEALDEDVTGVSLSLTVVQPDAKCYRATFTRSGEPTVMTFTPTAGSTAPIALTGMTAGVYSLVLDAFNLACTSVVTSTPVTWTGSVNSLTVNPGILTPVTIILRRPAGAAVTVDYDTAVSISTSAAGLAVYNIAVFEPHAYVARNSLLERVPTVGGGLESLVTGTNIRSVQADTTGVYYSEIGGTAPGVFWVPPGQGKVRLSTNKAHMMALTSSSLIIGSSTGTGLGLIEKVTTTGTTTTLASGLYNPARMVTDGKTVYFNGDTATGFTISKVPVAGGAVTELVAIPSKLLATPYDLAADATHLYYTLASTPGPNNGIYRMPIDTAKPELFATVPAGQPIRVLTDGSNVYFLVRMLDASNSCQGAGIFKTSAKIAGSPVTQLWSYAGMCPTQFAQSATALFFDSKEDVRRVDK